MNARSPWWTALVVGLALALGLCGLRWGLPSRERLDRVLPPGADTPEFRQELMDSWAQMHQRFHSDVDINLSLESWAKPYTGVQDVAPGWTRPPVLLQNSFRSFYLRSAHEDEQSYLLSLSRMRPWRLELNPHLFAYGGAHLYSLGAWLAACAAVRLVSLHSSLAPYLADPAQMASLYFGGRLYSLAAYLGLALLLLRIGRRYLGAEAGILAALFFLLSPGAVVASHLLKHHMFWSFCVVLTLDLSLGVLESGGTAAYAAAGAASGAAVGAFFPAFPACFFIAAACGLRIAARPRSALAELKGLAAAAAASLAAFFATNPYLISDWRTALAEMRILRGLQGTFSLASPFLYVAHTVADGATRPVLALIGLGVVAAIARGRREPPLLLCLLSFFAGVAMLTTVRDVAADIKIQYFLGFLAVGQLLAGRAAADVIRWKSPLRPWLWAGIVLLLANLGLTAATYAVSFREDAGSSSNHAASGAWIEAHVPPGSSIGFLRLPQPSNAPYFRYDRYDLRFIESSTMFAGLPAAALPEYLAVTSPNYDERPFMQPALSRYELAAEFARPRLVPWIEIAATATTADPLVDIYRLKPAP
ncbi:MAG: hypothetical protein ACHQ49_01335 [Elusimicrobiota bacterium]